jgi:tungstate transport system ATP-binding protein
VSNALLQASGISVRRGGRVTLQPCDFSLREGEKVAVYGPNGAGKSTLLQALAALIPLASGTISMMGQIVGRDLESLSYHRRIGVVFQDSLLLRGTVAHNVGLGLALRGVEKKERMARVHPLLKQLKIDHLANRSVHTLSGGEAQRTSLARALVLEPKLLFLDEPFASLDHPTRRRLLGEISGLLEERQIAALFITHDFAEASLICNRCLILDAGKVLQDDLPEKIRTNPLSERVAEILAQ